MTETVEREHELQVVSRDSAVTRGNACDARTGKGNLGLSWLDGLAATAFADGGDVELTKLVRDSAASLAGPDREEARVRLLSREIAICKVNLDLLNAALGSRLGTPDRRGAEMLDRMVLNA